MPDENNLFIANLTQIAKRSRQWAMRHREDYCCKKDLAGMCAIASGYLHKQLLKAGIESFLAINHQHCFVVTKNFVVDITATQFDLKPVCIITIDQAIDHPDYIWHIEQRFSTPDELQAHQIDEGWPIDQLIEID